MPRQASPATLPLALCVAAWLAAAGPAAANDRPFQNARTAVADDDGEATWSFESWTQRRGRLQGLSFEPEYTFTAYTSVQMELTRLLEHRPPAGRRAAHETEAEIEFKHLFNDIARDGWGMGLSLALGVERSALEGTQRHLTLKAPVSLALPGGAGFVHLNLGLVRPSEGPRLLNRAIAAEWKLPLRSIGFAELAKEGAQGFVQIGLRHWIRRERLAVDFSLQRATDAGVRHHGFILGVGWYDL